MGSRRKNSLVPATVAGASVALDAGLPAAPCARDPPH
jgi:hypothetical protein